MTTRLREHETIKRARERLLANKEYAKYAENIPVVYAAQEYAHHRLKLVDLRNKLKSKPKANFLFEDRVIRCLVFPRYESLKTIEALDLFGEAFREIFECE